MNMTRWIRHLIEHRLPPLLASARERLSGTEAVLRRVGRRSGQAGRRYAATAGGIATSGLAHATSVVKGRWVAARSATIPVLVRQVVFGALLLGALVAGLWLAASTGERSPATTPAVAAPAATSATGSARPDRPATGGTSAGTAPALPPASTPAAAPAQPPAAAPAPAPSTERRYTVAPGDTLAGIALRQQVPFEQLARRNGIPDPNKIRAGMQLTVSPRLPGTEVIQSGDALTSLTHRYGVSADRLTVLNPHLATARGVLAGAEVRIAAVTS